MIALFFDAKVCEGQDFSVKIDCMCLLANLLSQQEWQLCVFWWYCYSLKGDVLWGNWPLFKIIDWGIWYPSLSLAILSWNWYTISFLAILNIWTLLAVATLRLTFIFWNKLFVHIPNTAILLWMGPYSLWRSYKGKTWQRIKC